MSSVNYYLKNCPNDKALAVLKARSPKEYRAEMDKPKPIIMSVAHNGERNLFAMGKAIAPRFWDKATQRIKNILETPKKSIEDGDWLDAKKKQVEKCLQQARDEFRSVAKNEIIQLIGGMVKVKRSVDKLEDLLNEFFLEHKTKNGASIKPNTKKKYTSLKNHIISFQGHELFVPSSYSTVWAKGFKEFLLTNLNDNSICKYIVALKTFFNYLKNKGIAISANLNEIKVAEKEQIVNVLYKEELEILAEMHFKNPSHEQIRDIFLFHCYTGTRYSDIANIKRSDIKKDGDLMCWHYLAIKTDQQIAAPLLPEAIEILGKYEHLPTPLPRFTNQAVNRELKEIAKLSELNRIVKKVSFKDNRKIESTFELHKIISTHMARKTFISISIQLGVPERMVREVSGHRDERSFRRYVNLNNTHLKAVMDAWGKRNVTK